MRPGPRAEWAPQPRIAITRFRVGALLLALAGCSDAAGPEDPGLPEPARYTVRMVASVGLPLDSAVVRMEGPTPSTFSMSEGQAVVVDDLAPGAYQVAVEGWRDERVAGFSEFEETLQAGDRKERAVSFEGAFAPAEVSAVLDAGLIQLQWDPVPGAVEYQVEVRADSEAADPGFQGSTQETSLQIGPFQAGAWIVSVQAVDRFGNGGPPAEMSMTIEPERFPVTVQVQEGGAMPVGSVVSEPEGILCGDGNAQCQAEFAAGTEVVLKHVWPGVPQERPYGTGFGGWAGDCAGLDACVLTVDGPKEVVATATDDLAEFRLAPYILSSRGYLVPGNVTWVLTLEEAGGTCRQTILMNDGANGPTNCLVFVAPGTPVTISSPVGPVDWTGQTPWGGGVDWCESVEGNTCRVLVPPGRENMQVVWDWSPPEGHSLLQLVVPEFGLITSDVGGIYELAGVGYPLVCGTGVLGEVWFLQCSQVFPDGTTVTLTADPVEGYRFTGWTGGECSGVGPCEIVTDEFTQVRASFEPISLGSGFDLDQFSPIPAGTFEMGDNTGYGIDGEGPVHTVNLTRDFYLQRTEVTQAQWREIMGDNPSEFGGCDLCPVEQVSWDDVQTFLAGLNATYPDAGFRLPTEAEWEYAARAGTTGDYGGTGVLDEMGWYAGNGSSRTHPVALKSPNAWGLFDMHGNVREWVQDRFSRTYYSESPTDDPTGPACRTRDGVAQPGAPYRSGWCFNRDRSLRGGSFQQGALSARSASRHSALQEHRMFINGFRLVRAR